MTERMEAGRSARMNPQLPHFSMTRSGRFLGVVVCAVLILGIAIGSYFRGWTAGNREEKASNERIMELQYENQKLTADNTHQMATIANLQTELDNVKDKLNAIMPSQGTYNISPNQSMIVADGHLTIGLIGSPKNQSVNININSKQQSAAAGEVINIALDPSTSCQVRVQSFDMFKAVLTASCAAVKPQ